jgi:prophage DNA circulation protein
VTPAFTTNLAMNTSISYNVNAVVKEDDSPTIDPAPVVALNPNLTAPTSSLETATEEVTAWDRGTRADFFAGPEGITSTTADQNIITDETDAMDTSEPAATVTEHMDEPMENTWNEPVESSDDTEHTTTEVSEEITATSSTTTQAGRSYDDNYDPSGEFSDGDCP